jgi:hypothetical protein
MEEARDALEVRFASGETEHLRSLLQGLARKDDTTGVTR